jgi:acyl-CoA synthetase (AMP-forming)/AMP-acid ligase II
VDALAGSSRGKLTSPEGLAKLKPAFKLKGSITAGNASKRSDGAAAVVVMERERAEQLGLKPLVRYIGFAVAGAHPEVMGIGPIEAIPNAIMLNAIATIGAVFSPMNPLYKEREMAYQLENSEARAIVIVPEMLPLLQTVRNQEALPNLQHVIVLGEDVPEGVPGAVSFVRLLQQSSPKRPKQVKISVDDLLALPYSSGTTGLPKGAMLTHRNLTTNHLQFRWPLGSLPPMRPCSFCRLTISMA